MHVYEYVSFQKPGAFRAFLKNSTILAGRPPSRGPLLEWPSFFRPEPPSWLRPRCSRPSRRQHFNTRTTMLAVRCPDREQGCGDVPTACDSTAVQQIALPNVVERILERQRSCSIHLSRRMRSRRQRSDSMLEALTVERWWHSRSSALRTIPQRVDRVQQHLQCRPDQPG